MPNMYREGDAVIMKMTVAEAHDVHDLLEERYEGADLARIEAHMDRLLEAACGSFGEADEDEVWAAANKLIMDEANRIEAEIRAEQGRAPDDAGRVLKELLGGQDFYDPVGGMYAASYLDDVEPEVLVCHISADDFAAEADAMARAGIEYGDGSVAPFEVANLRGSQWKSVGVHAGALERLACRIAGEGWIRVGADLDELLGRAKALLEEEGWACEAGQRKGGPHR